MRHSLTVLMAIIIAAIMLPLCSILFNVSCPAALAPLPTPSVEVELSLSEPPVLGKTVQVTLTIVVDKRRSSDCPDTVAWIEIPAGFEFVSGDLYWTGDVKKEGPPVRLSAMLKAVQEGEWHIEGRATFSPHQGSYLGDWDELYVAIFKNKGFVSHERIFRNKSPLSIVRSSVSSLEEVLLLTQLALSIDPQGREAELTCTITALHNAPNTRVDIYLSAGFKPRENIEWSGDIACGEQVVLKHTLEPAKAGRWHIKTTAVPNKDWGAVSADYLRVYILDEPKFNFFPLNIMPFLQNHYFVYSIRLIRDGPNIEGELDLQPARLELSLGQTAELTCTTTALSSDIPNAEVTIDLPRGLELVSGDLQWQGNIIKDVPIQQKLVVKAVQPGIHWKVGANLGYYLRGEYFRIAGYDRERGLIRRWGEGNILKGNILTRVTIR